MTESSEAFDHLKKAQLELRNAIIAFEKSENAKFNYRDWSWAKGSQLAKLFESKKIPQRCLDDCKIVTDRYELIRTLPKGGCVAEVGSQYGDFAKFIWSEAKPSRLHLLDLSFKHFEERGLEKEINDKRVLLHEGDSVELIETFSADYFDWVYLDADHSYDGAKRDLWALESRMTRRGIIVCNDYTHWSPLEVLEYGVPKAIHEFCIEFGWKFSTLALHRWGYYDVALVRV